MLWRLQSVRCGCLVRCKTCRHKQTCLRRMVFHPTRIETIKRRLEKGVKYYMGRKIAWMFRSRYNTSTLWCIRSIRLRWKEVFAIGAVTTTSSVGKRTYSVDEVREILGISRRKAYELCNSDCFKVVRVGRVLRISKVSFDNWLDNFNQIGGQ